MKKLITENIGIKLISFLIAFLLWAYVIFSENPVVTRECKIPLETINLETKDYYMASELPEIKITYRANRRKVLTHDIEAHIHPQVNLLSLLDGTYDLKVTVNVPPDTELRSISPSHVKITLKKLIKKTIPIKPENFRLSLGRSLYSSSLKYYPKDIRIVGKKINISKVSGIIILDEIRNPGNYRKNLPVFVVDKDNKQVNNITIDPPFISVEYTIRKLPVKKVKIKATFINKLDDNLILKETSINPDSVSISAKPNILKDISYLITEPIDLSKVSNSVKQWKYIFSKEKGVLIDPDRVEVTLKLSQKEFKKTIIVNLFSPDPKLSISPATIEVNIGYFKTKIPNEIYKIKISNENDDPVKIIKDLISKNGFIYYSIKPNKIKLSKAK